MLILHCTAQVSEIEDSVRALEAKLAACEERQRELQTTRLALEKEITVKKTSISIDRDRCLRLATEANCQ